MTACKGIQKKVYFPSKYSQFNTTAFRAFYIYILINKQNLHKCFKIKKLTKRINIKNNQKKKFYMYIDFINFPSMNPFTYFQHTLKNRDTGLTQNEDRITLSLPYTQTDHLAKPCAKHIFTVLQSI